MSPEPKLAALRAALDQLDDGLHDRLMARAALSASVARDGGKNGVTYRPGREAAILRRLLARHGGGMPPLALFRIWREMLAASLLLQGPFAVGCLAETVDVARRHFGLQPGLRCHPGRAALLAALAAGQVQVAVLPVDDSVPDGLHRVVALPLLRAPGQATQAWVVSPHPVDPSGDDAPQVEGGYARPIEIPEGTLP